jgi:hypothetical protein
MLAAKAADTPDIALVVQCKAAFALKSVALALKADEFTPPEARGRAECTRTVFVGSGCVFAKVVHSQS